MKTTRALLGTVLGLLLAASAARAAAHDTAPQEAKWTFMVFLNAKNNLEPYAFDNFSQMAKVGSTPDVNVVVEFGRPMRHYTPATLPEGQWSKTLRFHVKKGDRATEESAVMDLGKVDMGSGDALADFVKWSMQTYPAAHYALVIWDHGQGWRFFTAVTLHEPAQLKAYKGLREDLADQVKIEDRVSLPLDEVVHGTVRYVSIDEDTGNKLYNRDIADSLRKLGKDKLDVIGFDACLMSMVETGYALRDVARVMAASQELEPGDGWDYERVLSQLTLHPDMDEKAVGKVIVDAYQQAYQGVPRTATTMAATDLGALGGLADSVSAFSDELARSIKTDLETIKKSRAACLTYAPGYGLPYIDLERFADQVATATGDEELKKKARAVSDAVAKAVYANYASPSRQGKFGSRGLSIYFPASKAAYDLDPDKDGYSQANTYFPVEFVQKQRWVLFLNGYWNQVP